MPQEKDRTILDKVEENVIASTLMKIKNEIKPSSNTNATEVPVAPTASTTAVSQVDSKGSAHSVGAIDLLGNFISSTHMEATQLKPENGNVSDKEAEPMKMEV